MQHSASKTRVNALMLRSAHPTSSTTARVGCQNFGHRSQRRKRAFGRPFGTLQRLRETIMHERFVGSTRTTAVVAIAASAIALVSVARTPAQAPAASGAPPAAAPALKTPWGEPDLASGQTRRPRRCNARRDTRTRNYSPRPSEPIWIERDRKFSVAKGERSAGPSATSPAPTTTYSSPSSAPARARR